MHWNLTIENIFYFNLHNYPHQTVSQQKEENLVSNEAVNFHKLLPCFEFDTLLLHFVFPEMNGAIFYCAVRDVKIYISVVFIQTPQADVALA